MIGLCIRYFHKNYGGVLQSFATVEYFKKQNVDFRIVRFYRDSGLAQKIKDAPRLLNSVWLNSRMEGVQRSISLKTHPEYGKNNEIRMAAFEEFMANNFEPWVDEYHGFKAVCAGARKYTAVISGSDQCWSPAGMPSNFFNLVFVPDDILKVTIASSFGVSQIPWYQKKRTAQFLKRIEYVSMRENRGSEIVRELTGRKVPTILDPVFLLTPDEWLELMPNEREQKEDYILAYFLGTNQKYRKAVRTLAEKTGLKVIALRHLDQYVEEDETFGDYAPYDVSPVRFLNLLRNAAYVCTDSYHGTAFSIMNHKQFAVFNRYDENSTVSRNSRIDTLCTNMGLEDRRYKDGSDLYKLITKPIEYSKVEENLKKCRKVTDAYMDKVMKEIRKVESK